jgi:two-component system, OmpR family, sensor histidine kinase KdpD
VSDTIDGVRYIGSALALAAATVVIYALKPIAPVLSLGVVYTLAVLATAVLWGLGLAIVVAIAAMVVFNFLFLPPVHTLTLADGRNWTALGVYLVTAVVASELATRARRRAAEAEQREQEAALLADAAVALLREDSLDEITRRTEAILLAGDDTARRRIEAAIASLHAVAQGRKDAEAVRRSDELKTMILHTVSHDLRTPLASIRAAIDGLELDLPAAERAELIETMRLEAARLTRLVDNVLDLSRLEAGLAVPHRELWPVEDLLEQAAADASDPARIVVVADGELPPIQVDAVQLERALANLLENALKFSAAAVTLRARREDGRVEIDVVDEGGGSGSPGLGLGLSIARGFIAANGGELTLEPQPAGGTRARLTFAT